MMPKDKFSTWQTSPTEGAYHPKVKITIGQEDTISRDDRVKIDADPETALRALVKPRKPSQKKK